VHFPKDLTKRPKADLQQIAVEVTAHWHPSMGALIARSAPETLLALRIRTSVPRHAWPSSCVTVLGDSINTMTPGRGAVANTALGTRSC